jgi:23S rRNA (guanosine2251-2'-O)-methyltransferase
MNLICGINPVLEALASGSRHFDRLLIAKGLRNRRISEAIARASRLAVPLRFETRETLDRMAGGVPHQGLIAVVSPRPASTLEELLAAARDPALFVVLDGVEDPRNLGAILRTAEAAGSDGVLLPDRHNAGLTETVNRASAGGLEHVRLARIGNVVQALEALKARGFWVVGFDATGTERWDAVDYRRPVALVLGGEGKGIRRLVREHCDHRVSLPLFGHVASLNVAVAAGIALYEVIRQRGTVPSQVRPIPLRPAAPPQVVGPAADDGEHDPGAHASPRADLEAGEEDEDPDVQVVAMHEEDAAWAGPTVLKPVEFRRGRPRSLGRGPGGKGRHRRDHGRPPGKENAERPEPGNDGSAVAAPEGAESREPRPRGHERGPRDGRRGRRRRRGRPDGSGARPHPQGGHEGRQDGRQDSPRPKPEGSPDHGSRHEPGSGRAPGPGAPPAEGGRDERGPGRRRRRRRRRR